MVQQVVQIEPAELAPVSQKMYGALAGVPLAPEGDMCSQLQQWEADDLVPEVESFHLWYHDLPNSLEIGLREPNQDPLASAVTAS